MWSIRSIPFKRVTFGVENKANFKKNNLNISLSSRTTSSQTLQFSSWTFQRNERSFAGVGSQRALTHSSIFTSPRIPERNLLATWSRGLDTHFTLKSNTSFLTSKFNLNMFLGKSFFGTMPKGVLDPKKPLELRLNTLQDNPGAKKVKRRVGRGAGSTKGKTAGRGVSGQNKRSGGGVPPGFEGGAYPMYKRVRKYGFSNAKFKITYQTVSLGQIVYFAQKGRLDVSKAITIKSFYDAGILKRVEHGVKILSTGKEKLNFPIKLEVSAVSKLAKQAIEANGGSVKTIYFNKVALRYHIFPEKYDLPVRRAVAHPSLRSRFDDWGQEFLEKKTEATSTTTTPPPPSSS